MRKLTQFYSSILRISDIHCCTVQVSHIVGVIFLTLMNSYLIFHSVLCPCREYCHHLQKEQQLLQKNFNTLREKLTQLKHDYLRQEKQRSLNSQHLVGQIFAIAVQSGFVSQIIPQKQMNHFRILLSGDYFHLLAFFSKLLEVMAYTEWIQFSIFSKPEESNHNVLNFSGIIDVGAK